MWPARRSTPPSLATSGKRWPGRTNSEGLVWGSRMAWIVRARSSARMPVWHETMVDRDGVGGAMGRGVVVDHRVKLKPLGHFGQDGHAEQALAVGDHELDDFGRDLFGGDDEVAFVLAVFGVDDDDDAAIGESLERVFDGGVGVGHEAGSRFGLIASGY